MTSLVAIVTEKFFIKTQSMVYQWKVNLKQKGKFFWEYEDRKINDYEVI